MVKPETSTNSPSLAGLVLLCHHRWIIPLVAEIGQAGGQRFAVLGSRLEVSGPSLRRALAAAQRSDLAMSNPGYGHPLRPEYLLTPWGEAISQECFEVMEAARAQSWSELAARKWSLPVLTSIALGCHRYSKIAQTFPTSTPRAVANALDDLVQARCIDRTLGDGRTPRPVYSVTIAGRGLAMAAVGLAVASEKKDSLK